MKKVLAAVLCAAMATSMFAAKKAKAPKKSKTKAPAVKHYKFGFTCADQSNPFFVLIEKTMRTEIEKRGDRLIAVDPGNDVTRQVQQIEDVVAQKVDGFFVNPAEAEGIMPGVDQIRAANIPIVNFDAGIGDMSAVVTFVGSDNYNAGKLCGEDLVKNCPNGGDILILDSPIMPSVVDRTNGFMDAIKGHGFTVVGEQDAKGSLQKAMGIAEDLLQAHPNVVAVFGGNDPTALGVLAAANAAGIKNTRIYGVDGSPDIKKEIASGTSLIAGTGAQSPINIAKKSVDLMYKIMAGEKVDARYPVETFLITKDNVAKYGTTGWQ